jgi:uroporphyrinogen-III synthase
MVNAPQLAGGLADDLERPVRVLITRAEEDCGELEELLHARGFETARMPCIAFEDFELPDVRPYDLVIATSPHAARRLRGAKAKRFAAVGAKTAELLGRADTIHPEEGGGAEALLGLLQPKGQKILLPRAETSTPALVEGLRKAGAEVTEHILYKTILPEIAMPEGRIDAILFASGSAVRGFVQNGGSQKSATVLCHGPSARDACLAAGLTVRWTGKGEDLSELIDELSITLPGE